MGWREEIEELHDHFEAYFLGTEDTLDRVEAALHAEFTMAGPDGSVTDRDVILERLRNGHGHADALEITTTDHRLLHADDRTVVAEYVEHHRLPDRAHRRLSTVVFVEEPAAPNGLAWLRVHETWRGPAGGDNP